MIFFNTISNNKVYHFEPLFECGRCSKTNAQMPDPKTFARNLLNLQDIAKNDGKAIYYSGSNIRKQSYFCGALNNNFCITPEGFVSSCYEVTKKSDPRSKTFFYGRYNKKLEKFTFNNQNIINLGKRRVENIKYCSSCIAKYSCAGDCPAKLDNIYDPSKNEHRCLINKIILEDNIIKTIQEMKSGKQIPNN